MALKTVSVEDLQRLSGDLLAGTGKEIVAGGSFGSYMLLDMNFFSLFITYFKIVPNVIEEKLTDGQKAHTWFYNKYRNEIKDVYFGKKSLDGSEDAVLADVLYFLYDDLMLFFDLEDSRIKLFFRKTAAEKMEAFLAALLKNNRRTKSLESKIQLLVKGPEGLEKKGLKIRKPKLSLNDNYNDDFNEIHSVILKRLSAKNEKGLVLLYGKPGTGKTSYIRYLISMIRKQVIFLPPNMAAEFAKPELLSLLIGSPNSVFVVEDAEKVIVNRDQDENSPVSALLNISDGLLADCLNIQVICTFNTDVSKIDPALTRQGRLIAMYEFKELTVEKTRRLSKKLGFANDVNEPMTLSAIYNQNEKKFKLKSRKNPIGFIKSDTE